MTYTEIMKKTLISWAGWYGVLAILGAYTLITFDVIAAKSYTYQLLNLTGALGIMVEAASKKDIQPVVLNIVWVGIALVAIGQLVIK